MIHNIPQWSSRCLDMLIDKKRSFPIFPAHPNLRSNDSEIHFFLLSVFDQRSIGASCRIKLLSDSEAQTPVIMSGNFVFASNTWPFCSHICMRHFQIRTQIHRKNDHVRDVTAVKLGKYPDHAPRNGARMTADSSICYCACAFTSDSRRSDPSDHVWQVCLCLKYLALFFPHFGWNISKSELRSIEKNNHVRDVTAVKLGKYPDHEPKNWSYRFPHLLLLHHLHLLLFAHVHDSSHLCHSSDAALGDVMNQTKEFLSQESNQPTQTNQQRSPIHLILPFKSFQKLKSWNSWMVPEHGHIRPDPAKLAHATKSAKPRTQKTNWLQTKLWSDMRRRAELLRNFEQVGMHCLPISSTARLRVLAGKKIRSSVQNLRPTKSDDHLAGGGVLQPRSSIRCEKWTLRMKLDVQIKESLDFTLYDPIALLEPGEVSRKGLGKHLLKHPKRKSLDLGISTLRICFHEPRFVSSNHFHKTIECNWYKWGTNLYILYNIYIPNLI